MAVCALCRVHAEDMYRRLRGRFLEHAVLIWTKDDPAVNAPDVWAKRGLSR